MKDKIMPFVLVIVGSMMFGISVNLFVVSLNLFSSGLLGFSQVIRSIINLVTQNTSGYDYSGIIYFLLNIPLYLIAYKALSFRFFLLSIISTIVQSMTLAIVPIPQVMIFEDILTSILVGGIMGGVGIGLCLRAGGSGGGFDIIGVYFAMKYKDFSVGKISLILNAIVMIFSAILFNFQIAIYSILYITIFTLTLDKMHSQNIVSYCMIFTHSPQAKKDIMSKLGRGVTYWHGYGAYTDNENEVLVTIISKYEEAGLKKIVLDVDPHAFIIISEGMHVVGNYEKRLVG